MQTDPEMLSTAAFAGLAEFVPATPGAACPIKQKAESEMAKRGRMGINRSEQQLTLKAELNCTFYRPSQTYEQTVIKSRLDEIQTTILSDRKVRGGQRPHVRTCSGELRH